MNENDDEDYYNSPNYNNSQSNKKVFKPTIEQEFEEFEENEDSITSALMGKNPNDFKNSKTS